MAAPIVVRLRRLADGLQKTIDAKRDPGVSRQNLTPRRARIADGMRADADRMAQVQIVLRRVADAHESPAGWPALLALAPDANRWSSKADVERLPSSLLASLAGPLVESSTDRVRRLERSLVGVRFDGFFPTPSALADEVVLFAGIEEGHRVLEPSAGKGDLAAAVIRAASVDGFVPHLVCCERVETLRAILDARGFLLTDERDCFDLRGGYDRIVMNPPFEKGQDIDHVRHAFALLDPGGRLASVMSEGVFSRSDRKSTEFREWMQPFLANDPLQLPRAFTGATAFRQTSVTTRIVVLDKPHEVAA